MSIIKKLWNDCGLEFVTFFWGIICSFLILIIGEVLTPLIIFFCIWSLSVWLGIIGCFIVPLVDEYKFPNWIPAGFILILLLFLAILPPFFIVYYLLA